MNKILLAGSVCALLLSAAIPATAGELGQVSGPGASYNWGGFYGGLQGGYGWGNDDWNVFNLDYNTDGALAGGTLGFNIDTGDWVFGVETDYSWADIKGEFNSFCGGASVCSSELQTFGTFRGRVGYDIGSSDQGILLYGTGGLAYGKIKYDVTNVASSNSTSVGWTLGAGGEMSFGSRLSGKLEYLHYDLKSSQTVGVIPFSPEAKGDIVRVGLNYRF